MGVALSCLLLGEEPLLVRCGEVLSARGHRIAGVVTRSPWIKRWCAEKHLSVLGRDEYSQLLDREPIDLLLSVTYPALIAPSDIAKARIAALNYHDGPLPRYAGINGSAWAIVHGEAAHAVVFHHLTAGIDEGSVVVRRDVAIESRETSVSLNMKNAALAVEGFRELIEKVERADLAGDPQNAAIERQLFSRHDRPPSLCTVDWTEPAATIDRLVRACDFGAYPNRFGLVKVAHRDRQVLVREALPVLGAGDPGIVLKVEDEYWVVGCGAEALQLRRFSTLLGAPLSSREAATFLGVAAGQKLVDDAKSARAALSRRVAEGEPFFLTALAERVQPALGFMTAAAPGASTVAVDAAPLSSSLAGEAKSALIAALGVALSSYCRQDSFDLALVDAEARAGLGAARSMMFTSVPLRLTMDAGARFADLVTTVHQARAHLLARGAFLSDLVARHPTLAAQPDLARGELSSVAVVVGEGDIPAGAALTLRIRDREAVLCSDRLPAATLRTLAASIACVARRAAQEPSTLLRSIDLIDDEQKNRQLFEWNATARPFPDTLRIHDLFERQVERAPLAVALVCEGKTMTFAEVERAANRVAHALQARSVQPGNYVALSVPRGFDLVIAMLGIAKSGAAYVPVDVSYPAERALLILADAQCVALLTTSALPTTAPKERVLLIDGPEVQTASTARPPCAAGARDVCYAIYTSGSTGRPKGVVLTHRAVMNTLDWVNRTFSVGPLDRLLFVTSPGFDLSVYDVFGALGAGASVEIASESLLGQPIELARTLCEGGITIWNSAPPTLLLLVSSLPERAPASRLRLVMLSGDWIPVWMPDKLRSIFERVEVESLGGATEAAIWSNHHAIRRLDPAWTSIPYGRPIQNARYYVLDRRLRPLPVGLGGDLYIGGVCLAEGYLSQPALTVDRFLPDPFLPGERIYRTGDLARYWADGTLELLGRADFQVKVRGFRVELAEIEHAIRALPSVREAVCTTQDDSAGQKSVIAYVVGQGGACPSAREIRETLARSLPDFMVPAHIVALDALPVSPNGKLDRAALPSPAADTGPHSHLAPRTSLERRLTSIWEEILRRKPIGTDEDFFALGGHSLLAVMLISRIKIELEIEVPLSRVLEKPTIAAFAASITDQCNVERRSPNLFALRARGSRPPLVLVAGVGGYGFTYGNFPALLGKDQPVFTFQAVGAEDEGEVAHLSIEEMAEVYEREILRACPEGPLVLGGFSFGVLPAFELSRRLVARGRKVPLLVSFDGFAPGYPELLPFRERVWAHLTEFAQRDRASRQSYLRDRARNVRRRVLGWVGADSEADFAPAIPFADPDMSERLRKLWTVHVHARAKYRPKAQLPGNLLLVKAGIPEQWIATKMDDPLYGWRKFIGGAISVVTVPGDHTALFSSEGQPRIAEALGRHIDRLMPRRVVVEQRVVKQAAHA